MWLLHLPLGLSLLAPQSTPSWHDVRTVAVIEGRAWSDLQSPFDRLPARAEALVRPEVWRLSRASAGIAARFVTDSRTIRARWQLTGANLAMPHMAATGVSGLDLYARDADGAWRWVGLGQPSGVESEATLVADLDGVAREYLLYFPLYNGVTGLELGIDAGATVTPGPARGESERAPIVFYGTSITQGACASRPGMAHAAILGRRCDRPVVNLGFSGQGKLDAELGVLLAELDAAVYVLDCLPNMNAELVRTRAAPFVRALRAARPDTPIVLVEDRINTNSRFRKERAAHHAANHAALRAAYDELSAEGLTGLLYIEGAPLLGDDGEGAVDSSHPTDLGFMRQSDRMEPVLRQALARWRATRAAAEPRGR